MKILALFDEAGTVHALFRASTEPGAPQLKFKPAAGHRAEHLEVPAELEHLNTGQLHAAVCVEVHPTAPKLVKKKS